MRPVFLKEDGSSVRAYRRNEDGALEIIELGSIDGEIVGGSGQPIRLGERIVELRGWPDQYAIEARNNENLLIGMVEDKPQRPRHLGFCNVEGENSWRDVLKEMGHDPAQYDVVTWHQGEPAHYDFTFKVRPHDPVNFIVARKHTGGVK